MVLLFCFGDSDVHVARCDSADNVSQEAFRSLPELTRTNSGPKRTIANVERNGNDRTLKAKGCTSSSFV